MLDSKSLFFASAQRANQTCTRLGPGGGGGGGVGGGSGGRTWSQEAGDDTLSRARSVAVALVSSWARGRFFSVTVDLSGGGGGGGGGGRPLSTV